MGKQIGKPELSEKARAKVEKVIRVCISNLANQIIEDELKPMSLTDGDDVEVSVKMVVTIVAGVDPDNPSIYVQSSPRQEPELFEIQ